MAPSTTLSTPVPQEHTATTLDYRWSQTVCHVLEDITVTNRLRQITLRFVMLGKYYNPQGMGVRRITVVLWFPPPVKLTATI